MNLYRVLLAAGAVAVSSAASADVIFCNATGRATKQRFHTPFLDIGTNGDAAVSVGDAFESYLNATHPEGDGWDATCDKEPTLSRSQSRLDWFKYNNPTSQWIATDFTGGLPLATDNSREPGTAGAHLSVEKTGPTPAEAAAERTARELEGQRAAAAANAKRVADAARSQAETQAKIAKFMAELKKRGSAQ